MRIGINCCNINPDYSGGVNTYAFGLIDGFSNISTKHEFIIFCFSDHSFLFEKYKSHANFEIHLLEDISKFKKKIIWQFVKIKWLKGYRFFVNFFYRNMSSCIDTYCDLIYFPNTVMNPFNYKKTSVVSMHDIQQVHFPHFFSKLELSSRWITFTLTAKYADYIQASSKQMQDDFISYFTFLKKENLFVIHEGVNITAFQKKTNPDYIYSKYNIPDKFLFYPAQLWSHKNHITVLKALLLLRDKYAISIPLVLTGAKFSAGDTIFDFINMNNLSGVYYLGKIPFDDILALYQKAKFLLTAVLYESSSLPILEAAASGVPIMASETPANQELTEKLKINLFPPLNIEKLADLIRSLWDNSEVCKEQVEHNLMNIEKYSWNNVAIQYIKKIEEIAPNVAH